MGAQRLLHTRRQVVPVTILFKSFRKLNAEVMGLSTQNICMSSVPFSNYYGTEGEGEGGDGPLRLLKRTMNLNTNVYQFLVAGKVSFSRGCSSIVP